MFAPYMLEDWQLGTLLSAGKQGQHRSSPQGIPEIDGWRSWKDSDKTGTAKAALLMCPETSVAWKTDQSQGEPDVGRQE